MPARTKRGTLQTRPRADRRPSLNGRRDNRHHRRGSERSRQLSNAPMPRRLGPAHPPNDLFRTQSQVRVRRRRRAQRRAWSRRAPRSYLARSPALPAALLAPPSTAPESPGCSRRALLRRARGRACANASAWKALPNNPSRGLHHGPKSGSEGGPSASRSEEGAPSWS